MRATLPRPGATPRRQGTSRKPRAPRAVAAVPATPRTSRKPSRRALAVLTGAGVALAALLVTGLTAFHGRSGDADQVATLDGHPVTREELLFHMRRLAPTVRNELRNTYHLPSTFDWNTRAGAGTALRRLENRALDEIWRDKTTLVLAEEQGLVDSVDHADFLADLAEENRSRADAVASGRTVYGVTRFSAEEYYTHRLTELTTNLKKRLSEGAGAPLRVTGTEVRREFDADRDSWSANATTYRYTRLDVPVPEGDTPADQAARLRREIDAADGLAAVAKEEPGARLTTHTYEGGATTGLNAHEQDLATVLGKLDPGGISDPVTGTAQITFYRLDSEKVDEGKAFTDYSQRIRRSLVEKKFDQYVQRRVDKADIDVDTPALDAVNAEDVQKEDNSP